MKDIKKTLYSLCSLIILILIPMGVYAVTFSSGSRILGNLYITGSLSKGSGTFVIDHPLYPRARLLYHSFVESPDMKNLYDGIVTLDRRGEAVVQLPSYLEALNIDFHYQFFPLGEPMQELRLKKEISGNSFVIGGGSPEGRVSWQVTGIRHDPYARVHPIRVEVDKGPEELVGVGKCLHPEGCTE